jgi:hypothetical protein
MVGCPLTLNVSGDHITANDAGVWYSSSNQVFGDQILFFPVSALVLSELQPEMQEAVNAKPSAICFAFLRMFLFLLVPFGLLNHIWTLFSSGASGSHRR